MLIALLCQSASPQAGVSSMIVVDSQASMIGGRCRISRLETMMSPDPLPSDEPASCPTDEDEDPIDVPVANSGGNSPPPPPPKKD